MALILFANNASTTLAGALAPGATSAQLASGTGAEFPQPSGDGSNYFVMTFLDASTKQVSEIVQVVARNGDQLTLVRAQEGTSARAWAAGDLASNYLTAGSLLALADQLNVITFTPVLPSVVSVLLAQPGSNQTRIEVIMEGAGGGGCNSLGGNQTSGGGGGGGGFLHAIFPLTKGVVPSCMVGEPGSSQNTGGATSILINGSIVNATCSGGQGAFYVSNETAPGAPGGGVTVNGALVIIEQHVGGWGSDGQSATRFSTGNGAAGSKGGGGRGGNTSGTSGTSHGAGGGGAYDAQSTGNIYYGGSGGPGLFLYRYLP